MRKLLLILVIMAGISASAASILPLNSIEIAVKQEKQYKKINVSEVSKEALEKIKKSYGSYAIKEAHRADDGEYKLVLTKDGVDITATFTSAGDLIKIY